MTTDEHGWSSLPASEHELLSAVADTSGSVILGLRPDHRIFAWNRVAEALYQTPRSAAIGSDYVARFIPPEQQAAVTLDIAAVLAGKRTLDFENETLRPDGTRRTLLWNVTRVLDANGVAVGIVATGQDITERKEFEQRFRLVFEHTRDGLLLVGDSGVIDCNPAALRMLGLTSREELIGRDVVDFSPVLQPDGTLSSQKTRDIAALTHERGAHTFDWVHLRRDGSEVRVEVSMQHALLHGSRVLVVAWRDQTHRAELDRVRSEV
jgi:PAS domain S-box-containing protein